MKSTIEVGKLGAIEFIIIAGISTMINAINKTNPWPKRLVHLVLIGIDHIRFVKKLLRPPMKKKSTMSPIINPKIHPIDTSSIKIRAHTKTNTRNITENASPCKKYFNGLFHQGSSSIFHALLILYLIELYL